MTNMENREDTSLRSTYLQWSWIYAAVGIVEEFLWPLLVAARVGSCTHNIDKGLNSRGNLYLSALLDREGCIARLGSWKEYCAV